MTRSSKHTNCSNDLKLQILPIMAAMTTFLLKSQYTIGQTRLIINLQKTKLIAFSCKHMIQKFSTLLVHKTSLAAMLVLPQSLVCWELVFFVPSGGFGGDERWLRQALVRWCWGTYLFLILCLPGCSVRLCLASCFSGSFRRRLTCCIWHQFIVIQNKLLKC